MCVIRNRKIIRIRSIGLGNFSFERASAEQFILLQAIRNYFHIDLAITQDPRTNLTEKEFLKSNNYQVLPADNLLKPPIDIYSNLVDDNALTLLYMFHCEHTMYDSVLASYWNCLKSVIIIGNNFQSIINSLPSKILLKLPVLCEYSNLCESLDLNNNNYSFYSSAISYFSFKSKLQKSNFIDYVPNYRLI